MPRMGFSKTTFVGPHRLRMMTPEDGRLKDDFARPLA